MSIDLDTADGRKKYLTGKLDDLLEGINDSYGTLLMEELLSRLETTIQDFNDEMNCLYDKLVKNEKERQQLLEMLKANDNINEPASVSINKEEPNLEAIPVRSDKNEELEDDIPEWEKKLAKLEKKVG